MVHHEVDLTERSVFGGNLRNRIMNALMAAGLNSSLLSFFSDIEDSEVPSDPIVYTGSPMVSDESLPFYIGWCGYVDKRTYTYFLNETGIIGTNEYCFKCGKTTTPLQPMLHSDFCEECNELSFRGDVLKPCLLESEESDGMFWLESLTTNVKYVV